MGHQDRKAKEIERKVASMRVVCICNTGAGLSEEYLHPNLDKSGFRREYRFPVTVGREYVVYSIGFWGGYALYHVCPDHLTSYTHAMPACLFTISDARLSSCWRFCWKRFDLGYETVLIQKLAYPEAIEDYDHNAKILDDDPEAVATFLRYKEFMDREFD